MPKKLVTGLLFQPVCSSLEFIISYSFMCICLEFDKLVRLVQRQVNLTDRVPSFYIRTLTELEGTVTNAIAKEKEAKKKLNATHARALNGLRQKIKKLLKENEVDVKHFQEVSSWDLVFHSILDIPIGSGSLRTRICVCYSCTGTCSCPKSC